MKDYLQIVNFAVFTACLVAGIRRGWWHPGAYWFSAFVLILHSTIFYTVVLAQAIFPIPHIPTMLWGTGLRLHEAMMILGYIIFGRERPRR
jgi:hypothetical protein